MIKGFTYKIGNSPDGPMLSSIMFKKVSLGFILIGIALSLRLPISQAQTADEFSECNRLAGSPKDKGLPKGMSGVRKSQIKTSEAIKICGLAVRRIDRNYDEAPRIWFNYGRALESAKRYSDALTWYKKSSAKRFALASFRAGRIVMGQRSKTKDGRAEAAAYYQKSVDQGYMGAHSELAFMLEFPLKGQVPDYEAAARHLRVLVNTGDIIAALSLEARIRQGKVLAIEKNERIKLLNMAATAGWQSAKDRLAFEAFLSRPAR